MVCPGTGCAIEDARSLERRIIPRGIWCFQDPITSPKVWVEVPWWRRNAVAASPYGPAPITATSVDPAMIPLSGGRRSSTTRGDHHDEAGSSTSAG